MFLLLLLALVGLFYFYLTKNLDYWKKQNIPGPKPKILVGNFPSIYTRKTTMSEEMAEIYNEFKGKTPVVGIFRGVSPDLLILDPKLMKQVMITSFSHFVNQNSFITITKESDPVLGRNPFFSFDEEWKETRAEIIPAFSSGRIKALWPIMQVVYTRMADYIDQEMRTSGFLEDRELCAKYTTDVVSTSIFGVDSDAFTDPNSEIRNLARNVLSPSLRLSILITLSPIFPNLVKKFGVRFMPEKEAEFMAHLLRETIKYRKNNNVNRQDYTDFLIQLKEKKGLEEIDMVGHTASFFFDGIETSSITMANIFYELAKSKNVQDKLRSEVLAIKGPNGFEYDSVMELPYLEQVIYESLRIHPVLGGHSRICNEDLEITVFDRPFTIKKGTNVWIPVQSVQNDTEYYDQPDKFYPERFNEENGGIKAYRDKCLLLPFGDGPRICLGQRFAMAQMKSCIANLIANYEITLDPETPKVLNYNPEELMMAYKEKVFLRFSKVN